MFALTVNSAAAAGFSGRKAQIAKQGSGVRTGLDNTLMTINLFASFAWSFAVVAVAGIVTYTWATGFILTDSNVWLAATVAIMAVAGTIGRQQPNDIAAAKRVRNVVVLGASLGVAAFAGAVVLLGFQALAWLMFAAL
jgi:hypothetical protein